MNCTNCGISQLDSATACYNCLALHENLIERLLDDDGEATLSEIASRALHGEEEKPRRRWRIG